jgi:hypothetical protein
MNGKDTAGIAAVYTDLYRSGEATESGLGNREYSCATAAVELMVAILAVDFPPRAPVRRYLGHLRIEVILRATKVMTT